MADPITGIGGVVKMNDTGSGVVELAHVRRFSVSKTADNQVYATNTTAQSKKAAAGLKHWTAVIDIYLDAALFDIGYDEGDLLDVELHANEGVAGSGIFTGTCRLDTIENLEVDIEGSGMVGCTLNVSGHGQLVPSVAV